MVTELSEGKCGIAVWLLPALRVWEWLFTPFALPDLGGQPSSLIRSHVTERIAPWSPPLCRAVTQDAD